MSAPTVAAPVALLERIENVLEAVTRGRALKVAAGEVLPELRALIETCPHGDRFDDCPDCRH
jgi:hypothetical protein